MQKDSLKPFFNPKGVVIIGASREPAKLGYALARNLVWSEYPGAIHFVNPRGGELFGYPIYPKVAVVPDPVDLAVLLTPPQFVPETLIECGQRGIRAAIISTGGFRETGPEGAALEQRCLEIAHQYHIRLIGPNCIGVLSTHVPLDTTFVQPPPPPRGVISFISHSGAICAAVIDWVRGQGIGLDWLFSLGNQADVNETDILAPVGSARHTRVITMYLEGISNGRKFAEEARKVTRKKAIIALKVGRYESGQRAVASHTGALAGREAAFDAAFRWSGVIRANTTEEMLQWARALAWCNLPKGRNVAVLTNAGGPGVTAADALEGFGLKIAPLSLETENSLKAILPAAASVHNPVDMLASALPEQYAQCLQILVEDADVHSVMVIFPPPPPSSAGAVVKAIIPVIQMTDKPVLVVAMGHTLIQEAVEFLRAAHIPDYRFPEAAASALSVLVQRAESLARFDEEPVYVKEVDLKLAKKLLAKAKPREWLDPSKTASLMEAYGISMPKIELAVTAEKAVEIAEKMGFPVVMKIASPTISHKSDVGGVLVGLENPSEVKQGFKTVTSRAHFAQPEAEIQGVHIQHMIPSGQETIIGIVRDASFGPLVMFGSGGVEVEGLNDVAFALAPLSRQEAERLLESTWAGRKLKGFRNLPPADRASVMDVLFRMAQLALDFPQITEIEINPLRVLPEGQGAFSLDVRIKTR